MDVNATLKERGTLYGDPLNNLSVAFDLQNIYFKLRYEPLPFDRHEKAHEIAMGMVLMKIARIGTGKFCEDNYTDAIGYLEIARKLAKREDTSPEKIA